MVPKERVDCRTCLFWKLMGPPTVPPRGEFIIKWCPKRKADSMVDGGTCIYYVDNSLDSILGLNGG